MTKWSNAKILEVSETEKTKKTKKTQKTHFQNFTIAFPKKRSYLQTGQCKYNKRILKWVIKHVALNI